MDASHYVLPATPVAIQFSGGRTSGYMLHRILEANNGLPDNAVVLFENTGKERAETLDFVQACSDHWNVPIAWLEYRPHKPFFETVGHNTASRNGEPFAALIAQKQYLPNVVTRYCTEILKVKTARRYLISLGWKEWHTVIGFRADEAGRVMRLRAAKKRTHETPLMPLHEDGVTKRHIRDFWKSQPFDLKLISVNGKTPEGNCDGCFLKSEMSRALLARYHPDMAEWWNEQEKKIGKTFDKKTSWQELIDHVRQQPDWVFNQDEDTSVYCVSNYGSCTEY